MVIIIVIGEDQRGQLSLWFSLSEWYNVHYELCNLTRLHLEDTQNGYAHALRKDSWIARLQHFF